MKTSELSGAALDWAVAKCEGLETYFDDGVVCLKGQPFDDTSPYWLPTQNWAQGGPIIEREGISVECMAGAGDAGADVWVATMTYNWAEEQGRTPLIAAMRAFVVGKLGDEMEIPEELK